MEDKENNEADETGEEEEEVIDVVTLSDIDEDESAKYSSPEPFDVASDSEAVRK